MKLMEKAFKGISMPQFYKYGSMLFLAGIIGAGVNAKLQWVNLNIGGKISMLSSFMFQCLLLTLFITLYFQISKPVPTTMDNPEVENFLNELNNNERRNEQ